MVAPPGSVIRAPILSSSFRRCHHAPTIVLPPAPGKATLTAQGHPRTIFKGALERGNLVVAEATAKELPRLDLVACASYFRLVTIVMIEAGGGGR
jgi:hypothetical protein